jgi:uncharacterized protein YPO0396
MERLDPQMQTLVKALGLSFARERKRARAEQKQMLETLAYDLGAKFGQLKSEHRAEIEQLKAEAAQLRAALDDLRKVRRVARASRKRGSCISPARPGGWTNASTSGWKRPSSRWGR